jgi:small subunit ribosomal protein S16
VVKLRLKRFGRRNRAFFRLNVMDTRRPRDGRSIEELGMYDPLEKDPAKAILLNLDRVRYWLGTGAQPSDTVRALLKKVGLDAGPSPIAIRAQRVARNPKLVAKEEAMKAKKAGAAAKAAAAKK